MFIYFYLIIYLLVLLFKLFPCKLTEKVIDYYLCTLLKIFKYAQLEVDKANKKNNLNCNLAGYSIKDKFEKVKSGSKVGLKVDKNYKHLEQYIPNINGNYVSQIIRRKFVLLPEDVLYKIPTVSKKLGLHRKVADNVLKCDAFFDYMLAGFESVIEDEITPRFKSNYLTEWNLLLRNKNFIKLPWKVTVIFLIGVFIRYAILLPICFFNLVFATFTAIPFMIVFANFVNMDKHRKTVNYLIMFFNALALNTVQNFTYFHNNEYKPKNGGICVANHTSVVDALILVSDNIYSMVGQQHKGSIGILQMVLNKFMTNVWFERSDSKDRNFVLNRLRNHSSNLSNSPFLIFPEGTCINNTGVMLFKKGCFDIGTVIYPIAIRYDFRFGDGFWNSGKFPIWKHTFMMMTSWAIVSHVYYLPPMYKQKNELSIDFSNRVRRAIASKICLQEINWDGQLKTKTIKNDWKHLHQKRIAEYYLTNTQKACPKTVTKAFL